MSRSLGTSRSSQNVGTGALAGEDVQVGAHLGSMMDLVFVDAEQHHYDLAADVELVARAFFLPALERKVAHRAKRLLVDSLDLVEFALQRIDFAQDGKESSRHALFVVAPVPFQGDATHAFL